MLNLESSMAAIMPVGPAPAIKTGFRFSFISFLRWLTEAAGTPNVPRGKSLNFRDSAARVETVEVERVETVETVETVE
jgi:hypothetical protein